MSPKLDGKVAIVTGGGRGIGKAIAQRFATEGADLAITFNKSVEEAKTVADSIRSDGRRCLALKTDVSNLPQVRNMIERVVKEFGRIDVLVNNAGVHGVGGLNEVDEEQWDSVLGTNLKGMYFCSQAASKHMIRSGGGSIVNMSSVGGILPGGTHTYTISKIGVIGLTRALAIEMAERNVRVNAICPGAIRTEMFERNWGQKKLLKYRLMAIPMKRVAEPDEVAKVASFLASDDSSYVTGQAIVVDGGSSLALYQFISRVKKSLS
jgi:3-oxoacyl-[acyl-carrier protein] reductase